MWSITNKTLRITVEGITLILAAGLLSGRAFSMQPLEDEELQAEAAQDGLGIKTTAHNQFEFAYGNSGTGGSARVDNVSVDSTSEVKLSMVRNKMESNANNSDSLTSNDAYVDALKVEVVSSAADIALQDIYLGNADGTALTSLGDMSISGLEQIGDYSVDTSSLTNDGFRIKATNKMQIDALAYSSSTSVNGGFKIQNITWGNMIAADGSCSTSTDPICVINLSTGDYSINDSDWTNLSKVSTNTTYAVEANGDIKVSYNLPSGSTTAAYNTDVLLEAVEIGQSDTSLGAVFVQNMQTPASTLTLSTRRPSGLPSELGEIGKSVSVTSTKRLLIDEINYLNTDTGGGAIVLSNLVVAGNIAASGQVKGTCSTTAGNTCGALSFQDSNLGTAGTQLDLTVSSTDFYSSKVTNYTKTNTAYVNSEGHWVWATAGTPQVDMYIGGIQTGQTSGNIAEVFVNNMQTTKSIIEVGAY